MTCTEVYWYIPNCTETYSTVLTCTETYRLMLKHTDLYWNILTFTKTYLLTSMGTYWTVLNEKVATKGKKPSTKMTIKNKKNEHTAGPLRAQVGKRTHFRCAFFSKSVCPNLIPKKGLQKGRTCAPVEIGSSPYYLHLFTGFSTSQVLSRIISPSTVSYCIASHFGRIGPLVRWTHQTCSICWVHPPT